MKKKVFYDILLYLIIPLSIWTFGREKLGDYYAMLLVAVPGFVYTLYSLQKDRQYNITGIFILISLIIGRIFDLAAGSAAGVLWNGVYIDILYAIFYIITIIIKKPMGLYFFVDYAYLRGYSREGSKKLYKGKELFRYFQYFTCLFAMGSITEIFLKIWLINKYGVNGFIQISIIMRVSSYIFSGLKIIFILYVMNRIKNVSLQNSQVAEMPKSL